MSKWVIETVELLKKTYVVEAYTQEVAVDKVENKYLWNTEELSTTIFDIHSINEYEYNKDWSKEPLQKDWVGVEITTGGKLRHKSEWIYAKEDGRLEKQRLKGPDVNEIR